MIYGEERTPDLELFELRLCKPEVDGFEKIDKVFDTLKSSLIETVVCRHEQNAAFIAGGIGRLTGRAGVAIATSGPGHPADHAGNIGRNDRNHSIPRQLLHEPLSQAGIYWLQRADPNT
jgi:hypothetical protein